MNTEIHILTVTSHDATATVTTILRHCPECGRILSSNPFNEATHGDIAWAAALSSHGHLNNPPVLTVRVG